MRERIGKLLGFILIALCVICFAFTGCKVNSPNVIKCKKTGIIEGLPATKSKNYEKK